MTDAEQYDNNQITISTGPEESPKLSDIYEDYWDDLNNYEFICQSCGQVVPWNTEVTRALGCKHSFVCGECDTLHIAYTNSSDEWRYAISKGRKNPIRNRVTGRLE